MCLAPARRVRCVTRQLVRGMNPERVGCVPGPSSVSCGCRLRPLPHMRRAAASRQRYWTYGHDDHRSPCRGAAALGQSLHPRGLGGRLPRVAPYRSGRHDRRVKLTPLHERLLADILDLGSPVLWSSPADTPCRRTAWSNASAATSTSPPRPPLRCRRSSPHPQQGSARADGGPRTSRPVRSAAGSSSPIRTPARSARSTSSRRRSRKVWASTASVMCRYQPT